MVTSHEIMYILVQKITWNHPFLWKLPGNPPDFGWHIPKNPPWSLCFSRMKCIPGSIRPRQTLGSPFSRFGIVSWPRLGQGSKQTWWFHGISPAQIEPIRSLYGIWPAGAWTSWSWGHPPLARMQTPDWEVGRWGTVLSCLVWWHKEDINGRLLA